MKPHEWLMHATTRPGRPVRSSRTKPPTRKARFWAARGILTTTLVLGSLVGVVVALSSHGHVGARQPAGYVALAVTAHPIGSVITAQVPWMY